MHKGYLKEIQSYPKNCSKKILIALEWLKNNDLQNLQDGKYVIQDDDIFANVQEYQTKSDALYEAHRKYIDIQYIVKGEERIGIAQLKDCTAETDYDVTKDIIFYSIKQKDYYEVLHEGEFLILHPDDAHKPSINPGKEEHVKKIVVKVSLD